MVDNYNETVQQLFLEMMLDCPESYVRVQNIFNPLNFARSLQDVAAFIQKHSTEYKTLPTLGQIRAQCDIEFTKPTGLNESHYDWFYDSFEKFTRQQELTRAILKSADLLEKGEFAPIEKMIKDAVQIGLMKNIGTDYFDSPRDRLMQIKDGNGQVSTGWPTLDRLLFGGMNRGELNIFAGGSGSGKSLFMQNLAVNWALSGMNGIYITLELSEGLCSMRMDSMLANMNSRDIFKNLDDVDLKVKIAGKKAGKFYVKYLPAQSTSNDIRAYVRELAIQTGVKPDFIMVDYLDLLMPATAKVSPNDQFIKDKYVSEELRNVAKDLNVLLVTASQLNRTAVDEVEFDHSHIAGGISKINTADNVFGIFTSRAMRESGRYQLQLLKTRSSSGVGQRVELHFNTDSLRITDTGSDEPQAKKVSSEIMNKIKSKTVDAKTSDAKNETIDKTTGEIKVVKAEAQSTKLKSILSAIKQSQD